MSHQGNFISELSKASLVTPTFNMCGEKHLWQYSPGRVL